MSYLGNSLESQVITPAVDTFSGDGSTTVFTLSRQVVSNYGVEAYINNVAQNPNSAFSINTANQIVFTSAPSAGTNNIYVRYNSYIGQHVGIGQGTVTTSALGSISNINSIASNLTLETNGIDAVTIDQSQNVNVPAGNFSVGTGAPALYSKATVYYSGLYETTSRRFLDISGDFAGTNAAAATNAGATTGIRMGYPGLPGKYAIIGAISEDVLGYSRATGITFQTCNYDSAAVERLRIGSDGLITVGSSGSGIIKARNTAKWWITCNGFASILSSYGVASLTDLGSNTIRINYSVATTGGYYAVGISHSHAAGITWNANMNNSSAPTASNTNYRFSYGDAGNSYTPFAWSAIGFGDQA